MEAFTTVTPANWANCIRHVKEQEQYFLEMDDKMQAFEGDDNFEDVEIGDLDEIIAPDAAAAILANHSTGLNKQSGNQGNLL